MQHLQKVARDYLDGFFAGSDEIIGYIAGRLPMTVSEFVLKYITVFETNAGRFGNRVEP